MNCQPSPERFAVPSHPSCARRVLSVDDDAGVLWSRHLLLEKAGYSVLSAADGEQALRLFAANTVDLVILDYEMPGLGGVDVAAHIKSARPRVPVILVSAQLFADQALPGVDVAISKGQGPAVLLEKIKELLALRPQA